MSNQVTVRLDSRAVYAIVAILAVIAMFAVGWWLSQQMLNPVEATNAPTTANTNAGANVAVQTAPAPDASGAVSPGTQPGQVAAPTAGSQVAVKGVSPVSVEEQPVAEGQPRLWIEELDPARGFAFDMGDIPGNGPSEHTFTVKNVGKGELVITNTGASCGCTVAMVDKDHLQAGESTTVRVRYDPAVNGDQGKFIQKQIRITSNDPVAPNIEFTIEGQVASQ